MVKYTGSFQICNNTNNNLILRYLFDKIVIKAWRILARLLFINSLYMIFFYFPDKTYIVYKYFRGKS